MRLAVIGGGGFRVPLVYRALLAPRPGHPVVDQIVLHDSDPARLRAIRQVLLALGTGRSDAPEVLLDDHLDTAVEGCDAVFSAMRVGGAEGRVRDERTAIALGALGQETVGAGGIAYGLRTLPVALALAERIAARAPEAWVVNFTNPAGVVTEAMQQVLGDRVIGICDSPSALARRAARAAGVDPGTAVPGYAGLNHLGWLRSLDSDGVDVLPGLIGNPDLLECFEEGRLFGADWIRSLGAVPNEYLWYYYCADAARASVSGAEHTRGEVVLAQQRDFYAAAGAATPAKALALWDQALAAREETYFAEGRAEGESRDSVDVLDEGYEGVALALLGALSGHRGDTPARLVLDVRNGATVPELPADSVVEVTCAVDERGARPLATPRLTPHMSGLLASVKASEQATIEAARTGSPDAALRAFAFHPLIATLERARLLRDAYGFGPSGA